MCSDTVHSLFANARHPQRIHVGICQQNGPHDIPCSAPFRSQVRTMSIDAVDAHGPAYARYLCSQLYQNEDYYFQIDSHCLFVKDWDEKILDMIHLASMKSTKAILSHYPRDVSDYEVDPPDNSSVTIMKRMYKNDQGILTFGGAEFIEPPHEPVLSTFIAAGFLFAPRTFVREVPFDPYLFDLFTGEEILLTVRAFTHGWDVFTPHRNILYHYYTRQTEPKFWETDYHLPRDIQWKVKILSGCATDQDIQFIEDRHIRQSIDTYGLGSQRSVEEFYQRHPVSSSSDTYISSLCWVLVMILMIILLSLYLFIKT